MEHTREAIRENRGFEGTAKQPGQLTVTSATGGPWVNNPPILDEMKAKSKTPNPKPIFENM